MWNVDTTNMMESNRCMITPCTACNICCNVLCVIKKKTFSYITFILFLASIIIFVFSIVKSLSYALLNFLVNPFVSGHCLVRFVAAKYKGDLSKKFVGRIRYWQHVKTICDDFSSNYIKYLLLLLTMIAQSRFSVWI